MFFSSLKAYFQVLKCFNLSTITMLSASERSSSCETMEISVLKNENQQRI